MKKEAEQFLKDLHDISNYWVKVAKNDGRSYEDLADSVIFSVLTYIDGCGMENPIMLFNTTDDGDLGECINNEDALHERWYK